MDAIEKATSQAGRTPYLPPRLVTLGNVHEVTQLMGAGRLFQGPPGHGINTWGTAYGGGIELTS